MAERPISVGELLRREGQQSETHDSQARRALGGVAVGAVLAFGAVVGGLMIHNAGATPSDLPVAGGGAAGGAGFNGSVPIASTGTIGSNTPKVQPAANTTTTANSPTTQRNSTTPSSVGTALGGGAARNNQVAQTTDPSYPSSSGTLPTSTGSTSTGSTSTGTSTSGSTSTQKGSTNPGTSSANPGSSSSTPTTGSNGGGSGSGDGGGLLGGLGSTLGSVTQPVFNWFGGN
ncbi:MAG TPA: hypothetical protein VJ914_39630 [Pseudonocardiaceae bacterium]|nr:hypothetical protein [Pseudonocardiaceae bacterium]